MSLNLAEKLQIPQDALNKGIALFSLIIAKQILKDEKGKSSLQLPQKLIPRASASKEKVA
ncbi:MAG: hypothetical protein ACRBF0_11700 [Calditrichia bacterium]